MSSSIPAVRSASWVPIRRRAFIVSSRASRRILCRMVSMFMTGSIRASEKTPTSTASRTFDAIDATDELLGDDFGG